MGVKQVVVGLLGVAILGTVRVANAQSSTQQQEAAQRFQRGVELYAEGALDAALIEFERAYELVPNYQVLFNLAQVQAERQEYVAAVDLFERYLAAGGREITRQRRDAVEVEIERLRARVAELWIETNVRGAKVFFDGVAVGTLPLQKRLLVNAGLIQVRIEKPGYEAREETLRVAGGDRPHLTLPLVPDPTHAGTTETRARGTAHPRSADPGPNLTPFWISLVATGALGAATATFAWLAQDADGTLDEALDRHQPDPGDLDDTRQRVRTLSALTDGFGLGTALAAGLSVYFLLDPPLMSDDRRGPDRAGTTRIVPQPSGVAVLGLF